MAGAKVTVVNKQTGSSQSAESDGEGHWMVSGVQPGATTVRIDNQGFKSFQQEFAVNGSRSVRLGTTLEVAAATETVTVTGVLLTWDARVDGSKIKRGRPSRRSSMRHQ
ncbi:MAG: carboxypeptidase-like regulatory domain-containing protein [Pyrinomonadaceae bacterium]